MDSDTDAQPLASYLLASILRGILDEELSTLAWLDQWLAADFPDPDHDGDFWECWRWHARCLAYRIRTVLQATLAHNPPSRGLPSHQVDDLHRAAGDVSMVSLELVVFCDQVAQNASPATHSPGCWRWHAPCLAAHIRTTLLEDQKGQQPCE